MEKLFSLSHTLAAAYLKSFKNPWQALRGLGEYILTLGKTLGGGYEQVASGVWLHKEARVSPTAYIGAPCIIGAGSEVRHCAYIRSSALIGEGCVVGNSTEIKNSILFDGVQVPHYNYVGDSILGFAAHMGAGAITSNVRGDRGAVVVGGECTGLKKLGAMVGDMAEIGCNCVLNPGTVIGARTMVYPLSSVRGIIPEDCIVKGNGAIVKKG